MKSILSKIHYSQTCFEWVDRIAEWLMEKEAFGLDILPVEELKSILKTRLHESGSSYSILISELISLMKLWMTGKTVTSMAEWLGDTSEKCKNIRKFIIRLLPHISFIFGLFPLVCKKMIENNGSGDLIPATFGSLAGCIREGFDVPYKLAMYQIRIKQELTSRVEIHNKYCEAKPAEVSKGSFETYDDVLKRVRRNFNGKY